MSGSLRSRVWLAGRPLLDAVRIESQIYVHERVHDDQNALSRLGTTHKGMHMPYGHKLARKVAKRSLNSVADSR